VRLRKQITVISLGLRVINFRSSRSRGAQTGHPVYRRLTPLAHLLSLAQAWLTHSLGYSSNSSGLKTEMEIAHVEIPISNELLQFEHVATERVAQAATSNAVRCPQLPSGECYPYLGVSVLLLYWEEGDLDLNWAIDGLQAVFSNDFGFDPVNTFRILPFNPTLPWSRSCSSLKTPFRAKMDCLLFTMLGTAISIGKIECIGLGRREFHDSTMKWALAKFQSTVFMTALLLIGMLCKLVLNVQHQMS